MGRGRDEETEEARSAALRAMRPISFARFVLERVEGPGGPRRWTSAAPRTTIGGHERNDVVLDDRTVSRFHCEIRTGDGGPRVCDLGSRNATLVDGIPVVEAYLRGESTLRLGDTVLRFAPLADRGELRVSNEPAFGELVGTSVAMRAVFAQLERAAATDSTVLLSGETGTGKEEAALGLHHSGARAEGPFVVLDCGALPPSLVESELFGHERGAFTDALTTRAGALESAHGGTLFLDEIGELPLEVQPRLLRAAEARTIKRIGAREERPFDARIVAASHRDLRRRVNEGTFREDLFFRLAVIEIELPPLRERPEDLPLLSEHLLRRLFPDVDPASFLDETMLARIGAAAWPGNVRQLRNWLEQVVLLGPAGAPTPGARPDDGNAIDPTLRYDVARRRALDAFERRYVEVLLAATDGNISEAARRAGVSRSWMHHLMRLVRRG